MKRWIHSSIDEGYTNMIDEDLPEVVLDFLDLQTIDSTDYDIVKGACEAFWNEYRMFPSSNSMDSLDIKFDKDKGRFYRKYRPFVDRCKEIIKSINPSGYGRTDYAMLKIRDGLNKVEYNFPYGWKQMTR